MKYYLSKITGIKLVKTENKCVGIMETNLFSRKFKKKSDFSLNSGNFYVTLQPELCLYIR